MPHENNIYFKILYPILYVRQCIQQKQPHPILKNCNTKRETILDALCECTDKCKIWKHFFLIINKVNNVAKMTSTNCVLILNALVKDKNLKKLTTHITILNEIRQPKNLLKYQKKSFTNDVIIK